MSARWVLPWCLATAAFAAAGPPPARDGVHVVARGESASSLAEAWYGNAALGDLLLRYNGKPGTALHPGERLAVPYCAVHRIRAGESWSGLARRFLGRAGAARAFAELNGSSFDAPLRVGDPVVVPVIVRHTLARGETIAALAARYYGDARKATIVEDFGRIEDAKRLSVGTTVEIPVVAFRKREASPPEAPPVLVEPEPARPSAPPPRFANELEEARGAFDRGDYDHARQVLESLRGPVSSGGSPAERRQLARLLAFVYVAFDREDEACRAYRTAPGALDASDLDPDLVSPRIREVLARCPRGETAAEPRSPSDDDRRP